MGIIAGIFFFFLGFVIVMLGHPWEGLSLLSVVILCFVLAFYTATKRKCPHCGRLYINSSYSYCPYCGGSLKGEDENGES
ncbi:MAG: hypothetical protein ACP5JW_06895 [Candidatus Bathyarchaeia archaeon]